MGTLALILVIVAGILALLDIVLPFTGRAARPLTPFAVIILCVVFLITGAVALS